MKIGILLLLVTVLIYSPDAMAQTIITASGDFEDNSHTSVALRDIGKLGSAVHLALGDLSYGSASDPNNESNWCNYVKSNLAAGGLNSSTFPFQLISGNHEDDSQENGFINDFATCLPDHMSSTGLYGKHYYFDVDNVRVIMASPDLTVGGYAYTYASGSTEYQDVSNWIDNARTNGKDWIIVAMHEDCETVGEKPTCEVGTDLMNLLIAKNVDVILHGHDHSYQRSRQLALQAGCASLAVGTFNANCVRSSRPTTTYTKGQGPVDIITATGGRGLYDINASDSERNYFLSVMGANFGASFGNLALTINGTELHGSFEPAYGNYRDNFVITSSGQYVANTQDQGPNLIGDFNGDGRDDIAYILKSGDITSWHVATSTGSSFASQGTWIGDFGNANDTLLVGDFNGDGKSDIASGRPINATTVTWRVALSNGHSFVNAGTWQSDLGNSDHHFYIGDFNGDGRDDIAYSQTNSSIVLWRVGISNGHSFVYTGKWIGDMGNDGDQFYIGDFNGDGRDDILYTRVVNPTSLNWRVGLSSGHSINSPATWRNNMGDVDDTFKVMDTNKDRKDDIVYARKTNFYTISIKRSVSNGVSFADPSLIANDYGNDGDTYRAGDFDGDGADELTYARVTSSSTLLWTVAKIGSSFRWLGPWATDFGNSTCLY